MVTLLSNSYTRFSAAKFVAENLVYELDNWNFCNLQYRNISVKYLQLVFMIHKFYNSFRMAERIDVYVVWVLVIKNRWICLAYIIPISQITKFMGPTWGPPGSCRPQIGPMLAPWTLLSGMLMLDIVLRKDNSYDVICQSIEEMYTRNPI